MRSGNHEGDRGEEGMADEVILGNGGFARVLHSITDAPMLGPDDYVPSHSSIIIGVGDLDRRREIYNECGERVSLTVVSKSAETENCVYGRGLQVLHRVTIQFGCTIGENVLINFGALIDHDCNIGDHCVISPGAILCGSVTLGEGCFVGAGAIIIQGVELDAETFVPAGTLVVGPDDFRKPVRDIRGLRGTAFMADEDAGKDIPQFLSDPDVG